MIFETHAHYDDKRFDEDRHELLKGMKQRGIGTIVNIAADYKSLASCQKLSQDYDFIYYTAGIHPSVLDDIPQTLIEELRQHLCNDKCLGVGEIGLDYYWEKTDEGKALQKEWFIKQLDLAKEMDVPVVIHSRDACEDTMEILRQAAKDGIVCDVHCFSYSPEIAMECVKLGFYIGVGGVVTFSNAKKLIQTVEQVPLDRILTETDCPYLAPDPFRGERNDSTTLPYIIREIAKIKGTTEDEVYEVTEKNARKFYRLPQ